MPYVGLAFFTALVVAFANASRIRHWWRKGCDRCRLEDIGGASWTHTAHTCFSWRNPYRDKHGQVWEFGKKVKQQ
jgi:hypothetical protein